jgi:hypothetical protein
MAKGEAEQTRYSIIVKNKPGQLAEVTKVLSDAGVRVSGLQVDNLGSNASIRFCAPSRYDLTEEFRKSGLRARLD